VIPKNVINLVAVKKTFFLFSDDTLKSRPNLTGFFTDMRNSPLSVRSMN
jgi:hypothetical protein